jgi:2-keto-3-deoxy-galactonokinase
MKFLEWILFPTIKKTKLIVNDFRTIPTAEIFENLKKRVLIKTNDDSISPEMVGR